MKITFLGTNGWYDTKTGNTLCTLIETKKYNIIFDAGNGIFKLDQYLNFKKTTYLLISHIHLDHIEGLHILSKFKRLPTLKIYCLKEYVSHLKCLLDHPFTTPLPKLPTKVTIQGINEGEYQTSFPFTAKLLNHIDPTLGFRLVVDGKTLAFCTDTGICKNDALLSKNADVLIHECSFFDRTNDNWGHSSPEEVATMALKQGVKKLALTHFAANIYPSKIMRKKAEKKAKKIFANAFIANDGMGIVI